jgi:hypothetical protein
MTGGRALAAAIGRLGSDEREAEELSTLHTLNFM